MPKWLRIVLLIAGLLVVVLAVGLLLFTRSVALDTVIMPPPGVAPRDKLATATAEMDLPFEQVRVTTEDGLRLTGWFVPGENGATIMLAHGNPGGRWDVVHEARLLNDHGYSVLMGSFRAHDDSDGRTVTFGHNEQKDLAAWHQYLLGRDDVDPGHIGLYGESMGGGTAILYAAGHDDIQALATASAFALTPEVVQTFIQYENPGLPRWLIDILAQLIVFWGEREGGFDSRELDTEAVIADISPRPVLIMHGESDDKTGGECGQQLYDAAAQPKELWLCAECQHVDFEHHRPDEYHEVLLSFFDRHLLGA
jgi:dipeptidyl aminopeptidase/acylaminoacyl peptidase